MKTLVKILLLAVAVVAAIFGVLVFQKTIAQPPLKLEFDNQFTPSVSSDIESISDSDGFDTLFVSIYGDIKFLSRNGLIDPQAAGELTSSLFSAYVPAFYSHSINYFNKSDWDEAVLNEIRNHATYLMKVSKENAQSLLSAENNDNLTELFTVVANYYRAKKASYAGSFYNLESSKRKVDEAKACLNLPYISNNFKLAERLNSVPSSLCRQHRDYLDRQMERLNNYRLYTYQQFESISSEISELLAEYKKNAKVVYGASNTYDISDIEERGRHYYERAIYDDDWVNAY